MTRSSRRMFLIIAISLAATTTGGRLARAAEPEQRYAVEVAQVPAAPPTRELQPRYEPVPPQEKSWYNDTYLFAGTRGVANSTLHPAVKAPLFLLTVPLDLVLLPFAAIGGLFG